VAVFALSRPPRSAISARIRFNDSAANPASESTRISTDRQLAVVLHPKPPLTLVRWGRDWRGLNESFRSGWTEFSGDALFERFPSLWPLPERRWQSFCTKFNLRLCFSVVRTRDRKSDNSVEVYARFVSVAANVHGFRGPAAGRPNTEKKTR